jgi:hypothetical protein
MTGEEGRGAEPMPALLILYSTVIIQEKGGGRVEGDCPVKGVAGRLLLYTQNGLILSYFR